VGKRRLRFTLARRYALACQTFRWVLHPHDRVPTPSGPFVSRPRRRCFSRYRDFTAVSILASSVLITYWLSLQLVTSTLVGSPRKASIAAVTSVQLSVVEGSARENSMVGRAVATHQYNAPFAGTGISNAQAVGVSHKLGC
jgi:hypothetical protein